MSMQKRDASNEIERMVVTLAVCQQDAASVHDRCQRWCSQQLHRELGECLNELSAGLTEDLWIDRIVMNLEPVPLSDFERHLSERIVSLLSLHLSRWIRDNKPSQESRPEFTRAREMDGPTNDFPDVLDSEQQVLALDAFLHRGYLAKSIQRDMNGWPDAWVRAHMDREPRLWRRWLVQWGLQPQLVARLTRTFRGETLQAMIALLTEGLPLSTPLPKVDATSWSFYLCAGSFAFNELHPHQHLSALPSLPSIDIVVEPEVVRWIEILLFSASPLVRNESTREMLLQWIHRSPQWDTLMNQLSPRAQASPAPSLHTTAAAGAPLSPWDSSKPNRATPRMHVVEPIIAFSAGLVLLWPMLPSLFSQLRLTNDGDFVDGSARLRAACWLDWLVWQDDTPAEWRLPLNKLLCGLPLDVPCASWEVPDIETINALDLWLAPMPTMLGGALAKCTPSDLRLLFLQRAGTLVRRETDWILQVDEDASDILLSDLPWPLEEVGLPWMESPLAIEWL